MADRGEGVVGPAPGEDPWEFEWPDDAKEAREAEREAARTTAEARPAPRFFTAYVLGVWTVLAFVLIMTTVAGVPWLFFRLSSPIALIGLVAALPLGYVLETLTRRFNDGIGGMAFMLTGAIVGYFWTYMIVTWLFEHDQVVVDNASSSDRMAASILFMTATATAFVVARNLTDRLARNPKAVYVSALTLAILAVPSTVLFVQDLAAYL